MEALAEELRREHNVESRVISRDLTKSSACDEIAAAVEDLEIGLLINNAGFWLGKDEHYGRCDDARWMEEFRVHMFGTMAMCESFVQQVAAGKR